MICIQVSEIDKEQKNSLRQRKQKLLYISVYVW